MRLLDWILTVFPVAIVIAIIFYTQPYMRSVADFMSGGRKAGRYLLAVAKAEMTAGAVVFIALFEVIGHSGFVLNWWNWISVPAALIVSITGFVIYRFRETRALTLAQFFELRYSKNFRLCTGGLAFFAGIVNFGIMPVVSSQFFVYFLGLPHTLTVMSLTFPTYVAVMAVLLGVTLWITLAGGMVTLLVTNCIEGILSQIFYLGIIAALLMVFSWSDVAEVLGNRPPGESLLNPFDAGKIQDFNLVYVLMSMFVSIYGTMAWQNQGAYNSAGITPHESRMGGILGRIRETGKMGIITLLAVCAITYLNHPHYAVQAASVNQELLTIAGERTREQMRIPVALSHLLPMGAKGALCAVLLLGMFGGDSNHLHSWGSIFVQDIIVPLRRKPFSPQQHIRTLRIAIACVALFAFLFGCLFPQSEYIMMWWQITMAIYVGGAGAAIIGGLYWKKGTTAAAWSALLTGSLLSVGGIVAGKILGPRFPLNGMQVSFGAALTAIFLFIVISLLTSKADFNMDRLLHRGKYRAQEDVRQAPPKKDSQYSPGKLSRLIGFDGDYNLRDRWITGGLFVWSIFWFSVLIVGTIWNLLSPWPLSTWSAYWQIAGIALPLLIAVVTSIWFTWGGLVDMKRFFKLLRETEVNPLDDGTVIGHNNLGEEAILVNTKDGAPR